MALWAFCLGYIISSAIQVFVTRQRMKKTMGETGPKSVALGSFFGFVSSSCSFAALSTSRSIFQKGAGLVPALAFLLASTNLVVELGIVIIVFLTWQFVLGEYLGGLLLILVMWLVVKLTLPKGLEEEARKHARDFKDESDEEIPDWRNLIRSLHGWRKTAMQYFMEWKMVWKDVAIGFTVAGIIAVFVPPSFFQTLFVGSGGQSDPAWWQVMLHTLIGPVAAFFTFIGSMGNIPLAGVLFSSGVSFAGIMAFIFSDLVVFPVLRIMSRYFGWKMAAYVLGVFLVCIVASTLAMHLGFKAAGILPKKESVQAKRKEPAERFKLDYTFYLNMGFLAATGGFAALVLTKKGGGGGSDESDDGRQSEQEQEGKQERGSEESDDKQGGDDNNKGGGMSGRSPVTEGILLTVAAIAGLWLAVGGCCMRWGIGK
jgi:hypothetical protein